MQTQKRDKGGLSGMESIIKDVDKTAKANISKARNKAKSKNEEEMDQSVCAVQTFLNPSESHHNQPHTPNLCRTN